VFTVVKILSGISRFTSIAYVACKCSPKCMHLRLYSSGRKYLYVDQLQSCRPDTLYPNLTITPQNRNPEKYTDQHQNRMFVAGDTFHPSMKKIHKNSSTTSFLSYRQNSYNCLYPAMVKIPFKIPVSGLLSGSPPKSNEFLIIIYPTPTIIHRNSSTTLQFNFLN